MWKLFTLELKKKKIQKTMHILIKKKKVAEMMFAGSLAVQKQKLFIML